jgi:hypothetical protein
MKWSAGDNEHSLHRNVKNAKSHTVIPLCVFMAQSLIRRRDNFTSFILHLKTCSQWFVHSKLSDIFLNSLYTKSHTTPHSEGDGSMKNRWGNSVLLQLPHICIITVSIQMEDEDFFHFQAKNEGSYWIWVRMHQCFLSVLNFYQVNAVDMLHML